ncbi:MAG: hypothetical protein ACYSUC_08795, partial [Planctomycetota bacterium]
YYAGTGWAAVPNRGKLRLLSPKLRMSCAFRFCSNERTVLTVQTAANSRRQGRYESDVSANYDGKQEYYNLFYDPALTNANSNTKRIDFARNFLESFAIFPISCSLVRATTYAAQNSLCLPVEALSTARNADNKIPFLAKTLSIRPPQRARLQLCQLSAGFVTCFLCTL